MRPIGGELVTTITSVEVVEGLIFYISANPHLGTSFPLFHDPVAVKRTRFCDTKLLQVFTSCFL